VNEYTARNGAKVVLTNAGQTGYILAEVDDTVSSAYLGFEQMKAWREFARAEEDERLGRWRWPENPDYFCFSDEDGDVWVIDEKNPVDTTYFMRGNANGTSAKSAAAVAYFNAHPEPKPAWRDAKAGEVWALTFNGSESAWSFTDFSSHQLVSATDPGNRISVDNRGITAGRRIYPEGDS
jgi:hypothetical protein